MDYKNFFIADNKSGWKTKEDKLKKNFPEVYNNINKFIINNEELIELPFKQKIWHFINNIKELPKCNCGKNVNFKGNLIQGYNLSCSLKCSANSDITKEKNKITNLEKYGVEHSSKSKIVRDKYKKTCELKYGVDNVSKVEDINEKRENTILNKYGVNTMLKLDSTKDKLKDYTSKNYNVDHISKSELIKKQKEETLLKNYNVKTPMHSEIIKNKQMNSLMINHGVDNPMKSLEIKNKCINNIIETKFNNFINRFKSDDIDTLVSWSGQMVTFNCKTCKKDYSLSRELFILRNSKNKETCINCNPFYKKDSYGENELEEYVKSLTTNVIINDRKLLNGKELDIVIPNNNIAIEFDGLYWHNELHVDSNYHLNKTIDCERQGIQLIHIFEDEWLYKQDIVKSRIKNILGLTENKIFARKCIIKEVNKNKSKEFLDNNHIQGNVNSKIKLGLYYNNELVSLMTFGSGRILMGGNKTQYELLRFCNKLNTNVIGGAGKLLKYFIKTYQPKQIISYADKRWSQGNLYEKLGFEFIHDSKPNYYYIINNKKYYRFGFRKSILVKEGYDINKSEHQIMKDRGIYRIYDCGSKRYEINL
jgi:hypothetical protein